RHTRWPRDWSSDVCSSDLVPDLELPQARGLQPRASTGEQDASPARGRAWTADTGPGPPGKAEPAAGRLLPPDDGQAACPSHRLRSEERRVGKEWRYRVGRY